MPIVNKVAEISIMPTVGSQAYANWVSQQSFFEFLDNVESAEEVILTGSASPFTFLHSVAVPNEHLDPLDVEDLMDWSCNSTDPWGIDYTYPYGSREVEGWLSPPLESAGSKVLSNGTQLVFSRSFEGRTGESHYFEIAQHLAQALQIHFVEERRSYSRFNDEGDIEDIVRIMALDDPSLRYSSEAVTIRRDCLDLFLAVTESTLVFLFDSTRFSPGEFHTWSTSGEQRIDDSQRERYGKSVLDEGHPSYVRGFQLLRPRETKAMLLRRLAGVDREKEYASFITIDWKNDEVKEVSCSPDSLSNYFQKSDRPFEISPAFFNAEVLLRYKNDPEKYTLQDRGISCRNSWSLQTYDINEAGQVHTYLKYLGHLPYKEQLYWKSFNEQPKGPISKRAFQTDYLGDFSTQEDPLSDLKSFVRTLTDTKPSWWALKIEDFGTKLHYPVTKSVKEWADSLLLLDQVVVEGLQHRYFKAKAIEKNVEVDPRWGSIKLITEALRAQGVVPEEIEALTGPLAELHSMRTKMKGHAPGKESKQLLSNIRKEHGSLTEHFRALLRGCLKSLQMIEDLAEKGFL